MQISLDPLTNKTGDVWHVFLKGDFKDMLYGYKFEGKFSPDEGLYYDSSRILLDPCAKVSGPHELFTLLYLLCFFFIPNTFNMYLLTIFSMNKIFSLLWLLSLVDHLLPMSGWYNLCMAYFLEIQVLLLKCNGLWFPFHLSRQL